jgi:hypothetical protein
VLNWEPPKNISEIRSFLGLAGYSYRFIEGLLKIVKPLTSLLKKEKNLSGMLNGQESIKEHKKRLTKAPRRI